MPHGRTDGARRRGQEWIHLEPQHVLRVCSDGSNANEKCGREGAGPTDAHSLFRQYGSRAREPAVAAASLTGFEVLTSRKIGGLRSTRSVWGNHPICVKRPSS